MPAAHAVPLRADERELPRGGLCDAERRPLEAGEQAERPKDDGSTTCCQGIDTCSEYASAAGQLAGERRGCLGQLEATTGVELLLAVRSASVALGIALWEHVALEVGRIAAGAGGAGRQLQGDHDAWHACGAGGGVRLAVEARLERRSGQGTLHCLGKR